MAPRTDSARQFFPARLTPFEHYMWYDDAPQRPMVTYAQLVLKGPLRVDALRDVLPAALARHPLLTATVRHRKRARWEWVPSSRLPVLDIAPEPEPMTFPGEERIDLEHEPGLRLWVRHANGHARILMQVHHSSSDGRGKFNFLTEWLALYAQRVGKGVVPDELPPPQLEGLFRREQLPLNHLRLGWWERLRRLYNSLKIAYRQVTPLRDSANAPKPVNSADALAVEILEEDEFSILRRFVKTQNVTLNNWLLTELFRTALAWQQDSDIVDDRELMRLVVPIDIRQPEERRDSACNRFSMKFLVREAGQIRDRLSLMESIHQEMGEVHTHDSTLLLRVFAKLDRIPYLLRAVVTRGGSRMNAVLSNLGNIPKLYSPPLPVEDGKWRVGELTVEEVHNTAGVREGTPIAIGAVGYDNRLMLTSRADHRGFTPQHIRSFLKLYARRIRESIPRHTQAVTIRRAA